MYSRKEASPPVSAHSLLSRWVGKASGSPLCVLYAIGGAFEGQYSLDVIEALEWVSFALPLTSFETLGKVN